MTHICAVRVESVPFAPVFLPPHLRVTCWQELDYVFIVIYVVEISIRLTAYGRSCFKDGWLLGLCQRREALVNSIDGKLLKWARRG